MPRSPHAIRRITRRRFIAASGTAVAAPLALGACGADEPGDATPAENADALNLALAAQLATADIARTAVGTSPPAEAIPTLERLGLQRRESIAQIEAFIDEAGGEPTTEPDDVEAAESPVEAVVRQLERAIAAELDAVGELSVNPYRQAVQRHVVEDAAALAHLRSILGEDPAPDAFVFGPPARDEQGAEA